MLVPLAFQQKTARAEGFVEKPFENQWKETDQVVLYGTKRTFFWGPGPFAHANEAYAEASTSEASVTPIAYSFFSVKPVNCTSQPVLMIYHDRDTRLTSGQRRVQYFDKARMELTNWADQNSSEVTNGLLTVELVSGRLQIGDNLFLQRQSSDDPVAGDLTNNPLAPTYHTFNQAKLAYGVEGHLPTLERTGQVVDLALNRSGQLVFPFQLPLELRYARYFPQTGHNLADIFYNFFLAQPLGEDRWLKVMGYPISEPFWASNPIRVGGEEREVLIQLFERRTLTYTPSNPIGWQVEMGNIGQHYYRWRYHLAQWDSVPGNYRLVASQGKKLISLNPKKPQKLELGEALTEIERVWLSSEGIALLSLQNDQRLYLADLSRPQPFKQLLPFSDLNLKDYTLIKAEWSANGKALLVIFSKNNALSSETFGEVYTVEYPAIQSVNHYNNLPLITTLSPDGSYLAQLEKAPDNHQKLMLSFNGLKSSTKSNRVELELGAEISSFGLNWIGQTNRIILSANHRAYTYPDYGKVWLSDPTNPAPQLLQEGQGLEGTTVAPDGDTLVLQFFKAPSSTNRLLSFRHLSNPTVEFLPGYEYVTLSSSPLTEKWSSDSTYLFLEARGGLELPRFITT
jgi:hypothetical protein